MLDYASYFPRGIASGAAFCNREDERKRLGQNLNTGQHTLLISSRRSGKTSLVRYVISETKLPYGEADLFVAIDAKRIEQRILFAIKVIFNELSTSVEQTLGTIRTYFKDKNSKWTIGTQGVNLELIPAEGSDPATNIMEALLALDDFLSKKKRRAVLFVDEVQEIGEVAQGKGIEGALRHVAQQAHYLSFVFSGSRRHLLREMFYDKSRPLYKLCDRMTLERISMEHYAKHLNKLAVKRWNAALEPDALDCILHLTERHAYYVNTLCLRLWEGDSKTAPAIHKIENIWFDYVSSERQETSRELSSLSIGQRKILVEMANNRKSGFTGKEFLRQSNMSSSSVSEALKALEQKDYIEYFNSEYEIVDPLIKSTLNFYFGKKQDD